MGWDLTGGFFGRNTLDNSVWIVWNETQGAFVGMMGNTTRLSEARFFPTEQAAQNFMTAMSGFGHKLKSREVGLKLK